MTHDGPRSGAEDPADAPVSRPVPADGARDTRRAWWCVAAWFPALAVAFVAAEGVCGLLGFTGACLTPWWVGGFALAGATVVLAVPSGLAWWFARRAREAGDDRAHTPAVLLAVLTGVVVVVNLYGWGMRVLFSD